MSGTCFCGGGFEVVQAKHVVTSTTKHTPSRLIPKALILLNLVLIEGGEKVELIKGNHLVSGDAMVFW